MSKRTTKKELLKMLEEVDDSAEVVLRVRCNDTDDYEMDRAIVVKTNNYGDVAIICDSLSE